MKKLINLSCNLLTVITYICNFLSHFVQLTIRYHLFMVFYWSGLLKTKDWTATLYLFENEYKVPFVSSDFAAYLGTAGEMLLPVFVLLGMGGRVPALLLFGFNLTALISYPALWNTQVWSPESGHQIADTLTGLFAYITGTLEYFGVAQPWSSEFAAAFKDHVIWGALISIILFWGPGKISIDYFIKGKCEKYKY